MSEEKFMQSDLQSAPVSRKALWTGRIISAFPVLFLLMDGILKLHEQIRASHFAKSN